jgi:Transposase
LTTEKSKTPGSKYEPLRSERKYQSAIPAARRRLAVAKQKKQRSRVMQDYIAFDSPEQYTWVEHQEANTGKLRQYRVERSPGTIRAALEKCPPGTEVAVEATANWYWITDEIEQAGCRPRLVHPRKAKLMMGQINKTNKLDTLGVNILQRNGTLPTVWIPPGPLRELRELTRTWVVLVAQRTRGKNRITAMLAKWGLPASETSGTRSCPHLGRRDDWGRPADVRSYLLDRRSFRDDRDALAVMS